MCGTFSDLEKLPEFKEKVGNLFDAGRQDIVFEEVESIFLKTIGDKSLENHPLVKKALLDIVEEYNYGVVESALGGNILAYYKKRDKIAR